MTPTRVRILIASRCRRGAGGGDLVVDDAGNRESTDDAQVDADVTPIAARVGGTVMSVPIVDNQQVSEGTVLVEIDPRDFEIALERARAELADAEASAAAARAGVPITSTTAASNVSTAQGSVEQVTSEVSAAEQAIEAAKARLTTAHARQREADAKATKSAQGRRALQAAAGEGRDRAAAVRRGGGDGRMRMPPRPNRPRRRSLRPKLDVRVAQSGLVQARAEVQQASAGLSQAQTGPEQVKVTRARAAAAEARVMQARAVVKQAEANLEYTTVKAPVKGNGQQEERGSRTGRFSRASR